MASNELAAKLARRNEVIEKDEAQEELPSAQMPSMKKFNPYTEFKEFSRKEIQEFRKTFDKWLACSLIHLFAVLFAQNLSYGVLVSFHLIFVHTLGADLKSIEDHSFYMDAFIHDHLGSLISPRDQSWHHANLITSLPPSIMSILWVWAWWRWGHILRITIQQNVCWRA